MESMESSCPFCSLSVPLTEIERHANEHLVEEELAKDMELAHHIAWGSSPPRLQGEVVEAKGSLDDFAECSLNTCTSTSGGNETNHGGIDIKEKIDSLIHLQFRSVVYKVERDLMLLLKSCLELENGKSCSIISGHVDHFQILETEDLGWGCGWRNIQMLSSYLLKEREEAKKVIFGGSGFVPDIPSLQRWLEIAWERGFDVTGSEAFNNKIYGSRRWIGTTECAALLRSFGLRAKIVDFGSEPVKHAMRNNSGCKRKDDHVYGPMDKFLLRGYTTDFEVDLVNLETSTERKTYSLGNQNNSLSENPKKMDGHQFLVEWVWNHFSEKGSNGSEMSGNVIVSEKSPLYFQHDGHSRTIVGVQIRKRADGLPCEHSLLVLDPAHRTATLERSLQQNSGWQKFIKRGVHTLKKSQYQLCYIDCGIASGEELQQLKTIESIFFEV